MHFKCFSILMALYVTCLLCANWFDARLIGIIGIYSGGGIFIYPITYIILDVITEAYSYEDARRLVWYGLFFNFIFILYGQTITFLPSPEYSNNNILYDTLVNLNTRIFLASAISYLCSELFNSYFLQKMKFKMKGKYMGIRFLLSSFTASGLDTLIFCTLAFYGRFGNVQLIYFMLCSWLIKIVVELLILPFSVRLSKKLIKIEADRLSSNLDSYA